MTHTWKIYDLKRTISTGVVTEVTYACESEDSGYPSRSIGSFNISGNPTDAGFINYEELTEANILGWLDANVNKQTFEDKNSLKIQSIIDSIAAQTEKNGTPW
tara:strand:- start:450 stop:758 length:309 start_codon:yes stop_codon:yes gene_type:complete